MSSLTHLYVVQSLHAIKIGHASNLVLRLSNMRVDNPHGVSLVKTWDIPRDQAQQIELRAHYGLNREPICGEWFSATPEEACAASEAAIAAAAKFEAERAETGGAEWRDFMATARRVYGSRAHEVMKRLACESYPS